MSFEINIFINKIQRMPITKVQEMLKQYQKDIKALPYTDSNAILTFVEKRFNRLQQIPRQEMMLQMFLFTDLSRRSREEVNRIPTLKANSEKELKSLKLITLIESLQYIESDQVKSVLRKYHDILQPKIIETLIINLPENEQINFIKICKKELMESQANSFHNFMASISPQAQKYVLENFGEKFEKYSQKDMSDVPISLYQENIPIFTSRYQNSKNLTEILIACDEENLKSTLHKYKEQLYELNANNLMQILCLKTTNSEMLLSIWADMQDKLSEASIPFFKTFIRRLEDKERFESIYQLKDKFAEMDLNEIVELFEHDTDEIKADVLIEYRDRFTGEKSETLKSFMTESVKKKMIDIYAQKQLKEFQEKKNQGVNLLKEFRTIVSELKDDKRHRLFDDDYIKAIILGRVLLEDNTIDDRDESYVDLRQKYMNHLFKNLRRDNTVGNRVNNGLFYRIVKGKVEFSQIENLETIKALIYLTRNPKIKDVKKIENIVRELTEKQVQTYNLKLYKSLCEKIKETYKETSPLEENIQKLGYKMFLAFGYDKSLRILEHEIDFTTLEYLFNGLNLRHIELHEDGTPKINKKLQNFLFGSNRNDPNCNINRLLYEKDSEFGKYFSSIYNDWEEIYEKLNGNVKVNRILNLYKKANTFLKPDEYKLEGPIHEIGLGKPQIVQKAKEWYQIMRERQYSSIPKVQGNLDDEYTYEMLDLDDPLALAVGYITKCCFLIDGLSKESLYHSISNKNGRTFIVRKNGELIAQSWVWRNGNVLCFDNVEARGNYSYDKLLETYQKASQELLEISNQTENETESLKVITYGTSESRMAKPSKRFTEKPLPKVLEPVGYSDAKYEQYILAEREHEELYYGEVTARYQDPRPEIVEYRDIKSLTDKKIRKINQELDGIEYTATGKTQKNNIRKCTYVAYNKDWYIAITDNGKVEIQILKKDPRAIEECKNKTNRILKEIREDKIVVPTDIEGVGGDDR